MIRIIKAYLLLLVMLSSCVSDKPNAVDSTSARAAVEERLNAFAQAMKALSGESLTDFYSQDERFYWVEDGRVTYPNYQALTASLSGLISSLESTEMKLLSSRVALLDGETANIYMEYEQQLKLKSGYSFEINGAMTALMVKEDDSWRFLIGHSSTKKERGG